MQDQNVKREKKKQKIYLHQLYNTVQEGNGRIPLCLSYWLWIFIFDTVIMTATKKSSTANPSNQKDHPSLEQAAQALNTNMKDGHDDLPTSWAPGEQQRVAATVI